MARGKSITKELVIDQATQMAKENGIDNVTYNQLARELGIRPQSMYRYVANIREVRIILIRTFIGEMTDVLAEKISGRSPIETLRAFAAELYDISHREPWYYESLDLMHKYDILTEMEQPLEKLLQLVRTPIKALKPQEAERYTQLFMAITIGYAHINFTHFPVAALQSGRETYLQSMNEFIDKIFVI